MSVSQFSWCWVYEADNRERNGKLFSNSLGGDHGKMASEEEGGHVHYQEKVDGAKVRARSESFKDHFTQATLFWNSMTEPEKKHIIEAAHFELGKVDSKQVRERMVHDIFNNISHELATQVAMGIGITPPSGKVMSKVKDAAENVKDNVMHTITSGKTVEDAPSVSMERNKKADSIKSRIIAVLIDNGFDSEQVTALKRALQAQGASVKVVSMFKDNLRSKSGEEIEVDKSHITTGSIMFDAILVPGGKESVEKLKKQGDPIHFLNEAFKHCKAIGAINEGVELFNESSVKGVDLADNGIIVDKGVVTAKGISDYSEFTAEFIQAIAKHRHWDREEKMMVPA